MTAALSPADDDLAQMRAASAASERRCLVACADLAAGRAAGEVGDGDGRLLRHLARTHGLSGIAAKAMAEGSLRVSAAVASGVERDWADARHWASLLDRETARLGRAALSACASGLSKPLLLKGAAVARRYLDPSLRTYTDVDLLVPQAEFEQWAEVLSGLGYRGPTAEIKAARRREREGVSLVLDAAGVAVSCDPHACLFVERRAREVTYAVLAPLSEPSPYAGLLEPSLAAQLLVLALHLAHHPRGAWRMIWLRDIVELASPPTVELARALAAAHHVGWALERALAATEELLGRKAWSAVPPPAEPFGLARVHQRRRAGYLRHAALVTELGPMAGARYFVSRVGPRRFGSGPGIDLVAWWTWARRAVRRFAATPWLEAFVLRTDVDQIFQGGHDGPSQT